MIKIPGYSIGDEIYNGPSTLIYRAKRDKDNNPVIIKLLKKEYPTPLELNHFQHEYEILNSIGEAKGIVKTYDILDYWNSKAIVMEDIGGESLETLIKQSKINLKSFLVIAIKLCDILESIHKNNIIHKDIKPQNILLNPQSGEVELIDFSISTRLLKDNQEIVEPGSLEGTLQYISPEQTGRMNRSIDYRTDFYSLGVTFYEMLTGKLPFDSTDPMELVHAHIAKIPQAPHTIKSDIPKVLSRIVLKLMSKNAEDRYQSSWGLRDDLAKCYKELKEKGTISDFEIATTDISSRFQIPEKLYGREKERELILSAFDKVVAGGKHILFITGESGIGKTAIIHEIQKPIIEKHGFFISGKYDKF
jgi:serine/threonine protein kinase